MSGRIPVRDIHRTTAFLKRSRSGNRCAQASVRAHEAQQHKGKADGRYLYAVEKYGGEMMKIIQYAPEGVDADALVSKYCAQIGQTTGGKIVERIPEIMRALCIEVQRMRSTAKAAGIPVPGPLDFGLPPVGLFTDYELMQERAKKEAKDASA